MSNAWSHLPNAHHIDWVLESVKENPKLWVAALNAACNAAWNAALGAVRGAAWDAARSAAWDAASDAALDTAQDAIAALVAYDDCDQFLAMTYEKLRVWAILSEDHRAVLLLPMVYVKEKLANLTLQPA
jgi:hypothetical protein